MIMLCSRTPPQIIANHLEVLMTLPLEPKVYFEVVLGFLFNKVDVLILPYTF